MVRALRDFDGDGERPGGVEGVVREKGKRSCAWTAISSVGTMPVSLEGVWLASCASGKGLRSYPGLSMVFYNHELQLPR